LTDVHARGAARAVFVSGDDLSTVVSGDVNDTLVG